MKTSSASPLFTAQLIFGVWAVVLRNIPNTPFTRFAKPRCSDFSLSVLRELMASSEMLIQSTPMKRLEKPQEVARVVAFLCSDWASFITGETVHINGGLYIVS